MRFFLSCLLLAGLLLGLLAGCGKKPAAEVTKPENAVPVVAVVPAVRQSMDNSITLVAEFRPFREIDVMAKVSGYVSAINADLGDRVQTGQALARIEIPEMGDEMVRATANIGRSSAEVQRAKEDVRRAESASEMAQLNFNRLTQVAKTRPGLVAQQEIDTARTRALEASAQLAAARSSLTAAEQGVRVNRADESRLKTMFAYTRVTAPFPGVITRRYAEVGAMVQAGTSSQTNVLPIVRLAQDNLLRLQLPIPESAVPYVRVGFPVEIRVPTLDLIVPGRIARFSGQLSLATRTMLAEVDVPNDDLRIKAGMFAEVLFRFATKENALIAPLLALDGEGDQRKAYVVNAQNTLELRELATGFETSDVVEITKGVAEGERLVVSSRTALKPGQKVQPRVSNSYGTGNSYGNATEAKQEAKRK
ncbi:MAG: efflux RND transporter periplasmic adaptor subunit [Bryobacter sp.]|nr:efflux RND transporter periplasmic adaptor subunit [Bryobacter sp.]